MDRRWITGVTLLVYLGLYVLGIAVRRNVVVTQYELAGGEVPFTLESALQYRMTRMVYDGYGIPRENDLGVEYPEGVNMRETYSIGAEYVYSLLARVMPDSISISDRIRWASVLIFCLGIPAIGAYAWILYRARAAGFIAALFYAVGVAAVTRSSGIELSRENFALPFFMIFLALDVWADRSSPGARKWGITLASACSIAVAMMTWDMIQYALGLWILIQYLGACWRDVGVESNREIRAKLTVQAAALTLVGVLNPYLSAHRFILSPGMGLLIGLVVVLWLVKNSDHSRWVLRIGPVLMLLVCFGVGAAYSESYGHFGELLKAKIVHMNVKPDDPGLLNYTQRIMWTPALHSANWDLTKQQFPGTFLLTLVGMIYFITPRAGSKDFKLLHPIIYCLVCLGTFILFFRFHVFLIIYFSVIIGGWAAYGLKSRTWRFYVVAVAIMVGFGVELFSSTMDPAVRQGKRSYDYQNALVDWLEENTEGQPVLANFGISGPILAYAGNSVVLHPKFETNRIRERVRQYGEALFKKTEKELKQWADKFGVQYLVFSPGEFYPEMINLQMRYMVDAIEPSPESAAYKLMLKWQEEYFYAGQGKKRTLPREHLRYFKYQWHSDKYIVFKMISANDEEMAAEQSNLARVHLQNGNLDDARKWALRALQYDHLHADASWILEKALSLKRQGFKVVVPE